MPPRRGNASRISTTGTRTRCRFRPGRRSEALGPGLLGRGGSSRLIGRGRLGGLTRFGVRLRRRLGGSRRKGLRRIAVRIEEGDHVRPVLGVAEAGKVILVPGAKA